MVWFRQQVICIALYEPPGQPPRVIHVQRQVARRMSKRITIRVGSSIIYRNKQQNYNVDSGTGEGAGSGGEAGWVGKVGVGNYEGYVVTRK